MTLLLALGIGILVLIVGVVIYQIALQILDEGDYFFYAVAFFLVLFLVAGVALYFLLPRPPGKAHLTLLAPDHLVDGLRTFADLPYASPAGSAITYSGE
jgi:ATP/ADP translocase